MSGRRRFLDLLTIVNASRGVAAKHVGRQRTDLDVRARTSSVTKGLRAQGDRVAGAVQAASELARKLDDGAPPPPPSEDVMQSQERSWDTGAEKEGTNVSRGAGAVDIDQPSYDNTTQTTARQASQDSVTYGRTTASTSTAQQPYDGDDTNGENISDMSFEAKKPEPETAPQDGPSEEVVGQLFRSRRVANTLFNPKGHDAIRKPGGIAGKESSSIPRMSSMNVADEPSSTLHDIPGVSRLEPAAESSVNGQGAKEVAKTAASDADPIANESRLQSPETSDHSIAGQQMLESRVPSSRLGRLWEYGGLAASMAFGVVGEGIRRTSGSENSGASSSLLLSPGNIERLVNKLSKMRGAALKLGQMMSFQDSKMLPPTIQEVLQRVQDRANYMPAWQRDKVMSDNLSSNWRDLFESFEEVPMAAASIGQVHSAVLKDTGERVAVKVQYPGVADSIDSDLNNLAVLLTASRLLPKGLYLDKTIANARTELAWECDYIREAECGRRYKRLLSDETSTFSVPNIIPHASGAQVLTMEHMDGIAVTKISSFTQDQRDWIGTQILRLCLREICEFRYMQTDPNWTNFLYNAATGKLELLDFGASREYPSTFIDKYIRVLIAASRLDRETCRDLSIDLGYLTGYESQSMTDAHVSSILTLAEPFTDAAPEVYDFQDQTITDRVRDFIPLMLRERLAPPPEETYSLHRKLSGAFLLCARLGSKVRCRELFENAVRKVEWQDNNEATGSGEDAKAVA